VVKVGPRISMWFGALDNRSGALIHKIGVPERTAFPECKIKNMAISIIGNVWQ